MNRLVLVKPSYEYKEQIEDMVNEWATYNDTHETNHSPWIIFQQRESFDTYLKHFEDDELRPSEGHVPATTYFALDKERNIMVGAISIRHYLNEKLRNSHAHWHSRLEFRRIYDNIDADKPQQRVPRGRGGRPRVRLEPLRGDVRRALYGHAAGKPRRLCAEPRHRQNRQLARTAACHSRRYRPRGGLAKQPATAAERRQSRRAGRLRGLSAARAQCDWPRPRASFQADSAVFRRFSEVKD